MTKWVVVVAFIILTVIIIIITIIIVIYPASLCRQQNGICPSLIQLV